MGQIFVQTSFVGFHKWSAAPERVAFLREEHRHIFHVKVMFEVTHDDRDLEFFLMREKIDNIISHFASHPKYDGKLVGSCEMIARVIMNDLKEAKYPLLSVEISEDKENGAIIFP